MQIKKISRLIADDGKLLTNGKITTTVVDVPENKVNEWSEIDEHCEDDGEVE